MTRRVELHIEELVLHGFAPSDRYTIADAVHAELVARLSAEGISVTEDLSIDRLDAGAIAIPHGGAATGRAIGGAVHSALGQSHEGHQTTTR